MVACSTLTRAAIAGVAFPFGIEGASTVFGLSIGVNFGQSFGNLEAMLPR